MNARDSLIELFESGDPHKIFSIEETVDIELAKHAHELAEKQRHLADQEDGQMPGCYASEMWIKGIRDGADSIDPEVKDEWMTTSRSASHIPNC